MWQCVTVSATSEGGQQFFGSLFGQQWVQTVSVSVMSGILNLFVFYSLLFSHLSIDRLRMFAMLSEHIHCVQKKTPTHIFFHISMNDVWI